MRYLFEAELQKKNNGFAVNVPFNVWEVVKQRDAFQAELVIENEIVECDLNPLEKGRYELTFNADSKLNLKEGTPYEMLLHVHGSLAPMDGESPYSIDNPIRKIDGIDIQVQDGDGLCGQTCVAMLAGVTIKDVCDVMNCREWQATMGKLISALNYYGIDHSDIIVYSSENETVELPKCALMIEKLGRFGHYLVAFDGKFYDPNKGVMDEYDFSKLVGYLEIKC
ncbi:MAG: hypothetical protein K5669_04285 [Lachnospiraceae bacterium]|nr:hypothetical protein [Lachnospiraceae bacterium]